MIAKGVLYLFPDAVPGEDFIVIKDATGNESITHWGIVGPQPDIPALQAAAAAYDQAKTDAENAANTLRQQVRDLAISAVGVALNDLTAGQRNALLAILLWKAGAIGPEMTVNPLAEWVK